MCDEYNSHDNNDNDNNAITKGDSIVSHAT